jgi:flagellar biosynthesis protein FlhB
VPLLACFAAVLLTGMLFSGPTFSVQAVTPRLDRLSPVAGLKRVLEPARWFESLRDLVKLVVVLALAALAARSTVSLLAAAPAQPASHGGLIVREVVLQVVVLVGAGAAAFALLDVAWSRYRWLQGLRMTPSELKRELRETEGDPEIKGQRRRLHREVSEHRMLEQVRSATVVVVNPTHVAVALRWDEQEMDAPTVAASGRDSMARRIIEEARRANIPVVHDAPLARTLADLQPGEMIPEKLYEAVAGIIRVIQEQP